MRRRILSRVNTCYPNNRSGSRTGPFLPPGSLSKPVTHDSFVMQRDIWDRVDTSNTSPDSCVINVKLGVVCDPIQSDSTAHDHSDALILPVSQVYPAYAETYKHQSRTSQIIWDPTLRAEYCCGRCSENYKKDFAASYLEMKARSCWSRVKNYFKELRSGWTDFKSSRSSIFYIRSRSRSPSCYGGNFPGQYSRDRPSARNF
ncbi:hypothetical protein F2Q70_00021608 [Brassica cretica]|uniref:Uncharacterized protein n=1 Tax=Brassica cretica TaxID=69181 RepID=A0A8S9GQ12_BRACR|nr:hypothetical protein F2Q70_00021608 [Brassica cretica]